MIICINFIYKVNKFKFLYQKFAYFLVIILIKIWLQMYTFNLFQETIFRYWTSRQALGYYN